MHGCPGNLDCVLTHYGRRVRVVVLWRQSRDSWTNWVYLARMRPREYDRDVPFVHIVAIRFGGGRYRARIYGPWSRELRREEYLEQVSFGIEGPASAETRERIRSFRARWKIG